MLGGNVASWITEVSVAVNMENIVIPTNIQNIANIRPAKEWAVLSPYLKKKRLLTNDETLLQKYQSLHINIKKV